MGIAQGVGSVKKREPRPCARLQAEKEVVPVLQNAQRDRLLNWRSAQHADDYMSYRQKERQSTARVCVIIDETRTGTSVIV